MKRENCRDRAGTQPFSFLHIKGYCVTSSSLVPSFLQKKKQKTDGSFSGYQLGSFSDVLVSINDLHLQFQTVKWRALQGLFVFLSEVALILCGCTAYGPCQQPHFTAQFLLNFQGLHNFPPAVSYHFWLLSICQQAQCVLSMASHYHSLSQHREISEQSIVPESETLYKGATRTLH